MSVVATMGAASSSDEGESWKKAKPKGRDPQRIEPLLAKIREIWKQNPDLRLLQLLLNPLHPRHDPYYVEDSVLLGQVERLYTTQQDVTGR